MTIKHHPHRILQEWLERDLTAAAKAGELPAAFEVDDLVGQINEVLVGGHWPVVTGESGIGKTALVYEIVRRSHAGEGLERLQGKRFVQLSFQRRLSALKNKKHLGSEMSKLVEALSELSDEVVPFFRDMDQAYNSDLEPQLLYLAFHFPGVVLGEGSRGTIEAMLEAEPGLERRFVLLKFEEPSLERTLRILNRWSAQQTPTKGRVDYSAEAIELALELSHRFLARSRLPRKAIDLLSQAENLRGQGESVETTHVIDWFCRKHRVLRPLVDPTAKLDLGDVEDRFRSQLLGQEEAVAAVVKMIGRIKAGLSDIRRPFGVFLFAGPTGVGKTELAHLLAEYLFGSRERLIRLNLADFQEEYDALVLFGDPDAGASRPGLLSQRLLGQPVAVLLLDEFEKANSKVHDRFLQLFDEGSFINGAGETISCRSMIVIATSNLGSDVHRGNPFRFGARTERAEQNRELEEKLQEHLRIELLNRFDDVVHFHPLTRQDIRAIALRELEYLQKRTGIRQRKLVIEFDESVLDWLTVNGYDPQYGARFLRRVVERNVTAALADFIVRNRPVPGTKIELTVRRNAIEAKAVDRAIPPAREPATAPVRVERVDLVVLKRRAESLLAEAQPRMSKLADKKGLRSRLLDEINAPEFRSDPTRSRDVLERFRELDVAVHIEDRLAQRLQDLAEILDRELDSSEAHGGLTTAVQRAGTAWQEWSARLAEEGPADVWLVLSNVDPLRPAGDWLDKLTRMELAWCRRLRLAARVVAYSEVQGELSRVIVQAEGPGAWALLSMEHGIHRLHRRQQKDLRIRIDVIDRSSVSGTRQDVTVRSIRPRLGRYDTELRCIGRLERSGVGARASVVGTDEQTTAEVLTAIRRAWDTSQPDQLEVARVYSDPGIGARDPRTDCTVARLKEVLRGQLAPFLEAWRSRSASAV